MADGTEGANPESTPAPAPATDRYAVFMASPGPGLTVFNYVSLSLIALMFLLGVAYYTGLPDKIAAYISAGEKGITSKAFGLFALPAISILVYYVLKRAPALLEAAKKKYPAHAMEPASPAILAYFTYVQASIIAYNSAKVLFSERQDASVMLGIAVAYLSVSVYRSASPILPRMPAGRGTEFVASFNKAVGKMLAVWSFVAFLGFFWEKYLIEFAFIPPIIIIPAILYLMFKERKVKPEEISALKRQVGSVAGSEGTAAKNASP